MGDRGTAARNAGISGRHEMTNSTPRTPSIGRDIEIWRPGREVMRPKSRAPKMLVMGRFWTPYKTLTFPCRLLYPRAIFISVPNKIIAMVLVHIRLIQI